MGSLFDPVDEIDENNSVLTDTGRLTDNQDTYGQAVGEYLEREYYESLDYE